MNVTKEETPPKEASKSDDGKNITMAMIAKAAGVSQGAISSLLNDRDYGIRVSAKTRERVFRVCREMGYIPNDLRAVVRMYPERGDLCLMVAEDLGLDHFLTDGLFKALIREAPGRHLHLALYDSTTDYSEEPDRLPSPVKMGVASKFITLGTPNLSLLNAVVSRDDPTIHIGQEIHAPGITSIVPDYAALSRLGIEYLFNQGHRQIAILSGPFGSTDPAVIELNYGVRAGYDAMKIPIEAQNVIYGEPTFEHGVASVDLLLERAQRPTALFCFTDLVAAGVLHRAQERGLSIPDDLSVVGCGDATFAPWLHPGLTTVTLPVAEIARHTIEEMGRRIREHDFSSAGTIGITGAVIERGSAGAPASEGA